MPAPARLTERIIMKKFLKGFGSVPLGGFFDEDDKSSERSEAEPTNGEATASGVSGFVFCCW